MLQIQYQLNVEAHKLTKHPQTTYQPKYKNTKNRKKDNRTSILKFSR